MKVIDPLDVGAVDELIGVHREKQLRLAFSVGLAGYAHIAYDPQALVTEVLRLARTGAIAEDQARKAFTEPVGLTVRDANQRWRLEIGESR